jgi:hypothetical protein
VRARRSQLQERMGTSWALLPGQAGRERRGQGVLSTYGSRCGEAYRGHRLHRRGDRRVTAATRGASRVYLLYARPGQHFSSGEGAASCALVADVLTSDRIRCLSKVSPDRCCGHQWPCMRTAAARVARRQQRQRILLQNSMSTFRHDLQQPYVPARCLSLPQCVRLFRARACSRKKLER